MESQKEAIKLEGLVLSKKFRYFYAGHIYCLTEARMCTNGKFYFLHPEKDTYVKFDGVKKFTVHVLPIILNHKEFIELISVED